jgi:hypothetical protein
MKGFLIPCTCPSTEVSCFLFKPKQGLGMRRSKKIKKVNFALEQAMKAPLEE